ncbi:NUDIX hydrolase [Nakamurella lactea]|uniref:NUDIX hydrolase n=1 Tax=Nakamurella lactea TaxID=459515 RepID=UPI00068774A4|nr:NUDIX domain-containing protein [Nakamurella lactea]
MSADPRPPDPAVRIRPAATVMLLRDGAAGPEVFVLQRVASMAFAGGMTAFPGGGVDDRDQVTPDWAGPAPDWWADRFAADSVLAAAVVTAAVRELFEETGVLLADLPPGSAATDPAVREDLRRGIVGHRTGIEALGATIRADLLRPWARWVTPPGQPRRYDTFFLAAVAPAGAEPQLLTTEAEIGRWVRPQDALDAGRKGEIALMPPTVAMLSDLAALPSATDLLQIDRRVHPASPRVISAEGESVVVRFGDHEFGALGMPVPPMTS